MLAPSHVKYGSSNWFFGAVGLVFDFYVRPILAFRKTPNVAQRDLLKVVF
jgi:hypothetical protein